MIIKKKNKINSIIINHKIKNEYILNNIYYMTNANFILQNCIEYKKNMDEVHK